VMYAFGDQDRDTSNHSITVQGNQLCTGYILEVYRG
jgi:hypothetical protein